jgi:hypothetical protein
MNVPPFDETLRMEPVLHPGWDHNGSKEKCFSEHQAR